MKNHLLIKVSLITIALGALSVFAYELSVKAEKPQENLSIGERFHHQTSLTWWDAVRGIFRSKPKKLPKPEFKGMTLEEAIQKRRSLRDYSKYWKGMAVLP